MTARLVQGYEVVIGFETHAQLSTHSKIFSRASVAFGAEPNTAGLRPGHGPAWHAASDEQGCGGARH